MKAEISTAAWLYPYSDDSGDKLRVEVLRNGDVEIEGPVDQVITIKAVDVREVYWLADALTKAGELSKKRPIA